MSSSIERATNLAKLMAVYSRLCKTKNVSSLARELGQLPVNVINAIHAGVSKDIFTAKKAKDGWEKIEVSDEQFATLGLLDGFSDGLLESYKDMLLLLANINSEESDILIEQLQQWTGAPESYFKLMIEVGKINLDLTTYVLIDPKDKKSSYEFVTLKRNEGRQFGKKQFKKG